MNRNIKHCARVVAAGLLLLAVGCSDDSEAPVVPDPGVIGGIQTNLTDPAALIEAHDRAWNEQNHAAYEALLDDEFEFYPLPEDAQNFPWMGGSSSWDRTIELGMAANMFDDDYTQGEGSVDLIEMNVAVQQMETKDDGRVEVTTHAAIRVMWNSTDGAATDTRLKFELIPRDGFLRVREIRELPRIVAGHADVPETTWGGLKGLYR